MQAHACKLSQEGELRPQLLDRFGLSVNVSTLMDKEQRVQVLFVACLSSSLLLPLLWRTAHCMNSA
jgi:hypothetical protein